MRNFDGSKMKLRYLLLPGGILILIKVISNFYYDFIFRVPGPLEKFGTEVRELTIFLSIIIFLVLLGGRGNENRTAVDKPARFHHVWWLGFVLVLLSAFSLAMIVNPHGRFPSDKFPPVTVGARKIKFNLYRDLKPVPELVVMGSSRAFTISPKYIKEVTEYSSFNFSVESARIGDYYIQSRYIVSEKSAPRVFLMEINQNSFGDQSDTWIRQPLNMIFFMPWKGAVALAEESIEEVLGIQSVSDAMYSMILSMHKRQIWTINIDKYGTGIRTQPSYEEYKVLLKANMSNPTMNGLYCKVLNSDSITILEDIIKIARENGIGVVLYESPMNYTFYNIAYKRNPVDFQRCRELINSSLSALLEEHPNVFFRDLSVYEPIGKLQEEGFYDGIHLNPKAAEMVINTLRPELDAAMAWALLNSTR